MAWLICGTAVVIYEAIYYVRKWIAENRQKDVFGIYPDEWVKVR